MNEQSTGKNIEILIKNILTEYELDIKKLFAITIDSGRNMMASIKTLNESTDFFQTQKTESCEYEESSKEEDNGALDLDSIKNEMNAEMCLVLGKNTHNLLCCPHAAVRNKRFFKQNKSVFL